MSKVAVIRCSSYDEAQVYDAVKKGIDLVGGIEQFVKKDEKILLKPNQLSGTAPEKVTTTHPSVFKAIGKILKGSGYDVSWGDSPGIGSQKKVGKASGITPVAEELGIPMVDMSSGEVVSFDEGLATKRFDIARGAIDTDAIISLSKMKTHQLTRITGAIKNQFGCVYGLNKAAFHTRFQDGISFSKMLIDLNLLLKPRLYIMDGVVAMEGNGPNSGTPTPMNVILVSSDPVALDSTFSRMIDLDIKHVPMLTFGQEMGLGNHEEGRIEIVGEPIEKFFRKDFDVVRAPIIVEKPGSFASIIRSLWVRKPVINEEKCVKCGICVEACPLEDKALTFSDGKKYPPVYDYKKCIRCYCCQEMCPKKAIDVKTPLLGRLLLYR